MKVLVIKEPIDSASRLVRVEQTLSRLPPGVKTYLLTSDPIRPLPDPPEGFDEVIYIPDNLLKSLL